MPGARRKVKLTKSLIGECAPLRSEYAVWDTACEGLHVRVFPTGAKSFAVFYRDERGRQRRRSLGRTSDVPVDEARKRAQATIADVRRGFDPFDELDRRKMIPTLEDVWSNYLSDHALPKKATSSVRGDKQLWKTRLGPELGKLFVDEITPSVVRKWHGAAVAKPYAANRALSLLSKLLSFRSEHVTKNACEGIDRYPEQPRETILTAEEVKALFEALKEDHDVGGATLVQLLAHTGARRGEGLRAKWTEFDLELGEWLVPSDHIKGGRRHGITIRRPLSSVATKLMRDWRACGEHESELVFPQTGNSSERRYDVKAVWERARLKAGLPNLRLHDLRHNFASMALMNGATLYEIGAVLGHRDAQTTARYAHLSKSQRSRVADLVGKSISDAMDGHK
jgi:integrase